MDYSEYRRLTEQAARAMQGEVVSLAGGYYGVRIALDEGYGLAALDLDSDNGWVVWKEDLLGERCCDAAEEVVGWCDAGELRSRTLTALADHKHG